tara:strand:- start:6136 stop:6933 length:798 start_codon:yes stop_codon:yes gene_type:complete
MPDRVSKDEMLVRTAIIKAKESIQEAEHLGIIENKDPLIGEEIKVKRPKKKPAEEKVDNPVSTDDINSGYGHVGSKEYFGKGLDSLEKLSPQLEGLLDELTQAIQRVQGKDKRELEEKMHEILRDIKGSPRVLSSAPSMDSEFRSEADIDERLDKEDEEEEEKIYLDKSVEGWKTLLKYRIEEPMNPKTMGEMVACPKCGGSGSLGGRPVKMYLGDAKGGKNPGMQTCDLCRGLGKVSKLRARQHSQEEHNRRMSDNTGPAPTQA